jgi:hypothetical protein
VFYTSHFHILRDSLFRTIGRSTFRSTEKPPMSKPRCIHLSFTKILCSHSTFKLWEPQLSGAAIEYYRLI